MMKYTKEEVKLMDEFARTALQSILTSETTFKVNTAGAVAHWSYEYAEEMIKKRREIFNGQT